MQPRGRISKVMGRTNIPWASYDSLLSLEHVFVRFKNAQRPYGFWSVSRTLSGSVCPLRIRGDAMERAIIGNSFIEQTFEWSFLPQHRLLVTLAWKILGCCQWWTINGLLYPDI